LLLGACAWQWSRRLFWLISPIIVLMPFACVYLRYHYVIDVLVGAALVFPVIWLSNRLERAINPEEAPAP
jgi:membrane-associated phospholipid phosphatase